MPTNVHIPNNRTVASNPRSITNTKITMSILFGAKTALVQYGNTHIAKAMVFRAYIVIWTKQNRFSNYHVASNAIALPDITPSANRYTLPTRK